MWSWLPALVAALLAVAKGLFGLDKPQQVTTDEKPSPLPAPADADVLRDMGIGAASDATISPGAGFTGGIFPTVPVDPGADTVRLYAGSDRGNPVCDRPSGAADQSHAEPDH